MTTITDYYEDALPDDGNLALLFDIDKTMEYVKENLSMRVKATVNRTLMYFMWVNSCLAYARSEGVSADKKDLNCTTLVLSDKVCADQTGLTDSQIRYAKENLKKLGILKFNRKFVKEGSKKWTMVWNVIIDWDKGIGALASVKSKESYRFLTDSESEAIYKEYRFKEYASMAIDSPELDDLDKSIAEIYDYKKEAFKSEEDKEEKQCILKEYSKRYYQILNSEDVSLIREVFESFDLASVYTEEMAFLGMSESFTVNDLVTGRINPDHIIFDKVPSETRESFREYAYNSKGLYTKYLRRRSLRRLAYSKYISPRHDGSYTRVVNTAPQISLSKESAMKEYSKYLVEY